MNLKQLNHSPIVHPIALWIKVASRATYHEEEYLINTYELVKCELINSQYPPTSELLEKNIVLVILQDRRRFENPSNLIWV